MGHQDDSSEAIWREILTVGHRTRMAVLPGTVRCVGCRIPMDGVGGSIARIFGRKVSRKSPNLCNVCDEVLPRGGAEIDIAVLFADVRDSTALGERMGPAAFATLLNQFYKATTDVLLSHGAMIDKMIGDEVMALFIPAIAGPQYRRSAFLAAEHLLQAVRQRDSREPLLPIGIGIHAGIAYVGKVGTTGISDFTALGDTVNTAARLQADAAAGDIVVSESVYETVADSHPDLEQRTLTLRGKEEPFAVRIAHTME